MKKFFKFPLYLSATFLIVMAFSTQARAQTIVCLETSLGALCMELLETEAPVTAENFVGYVNRGSYPRSFFHLSNVDGAVYVQSGRFVFTGGDDLDSFIEIPRRPAIINESSISNTRGTVAIVPEDPADPNSATSQFLINLSDNSSFLDSENGGYTVFARVIGDGMLLVDVISALPVISLEKDGLTRVPVIGPEIPAFDSLRVDIFEAYIYDGDINDFEAENGGTDGGSDGGNDTGGETPTPGEGETLYEDAVCVDTNAGEFCMELLPDVAPNTANNFLNYISDGRYDDTIIHRAVPNFVIQGGGYSSNPLGTPVPKDAAVVNEFSLSNVRGTVAMARLGGQVNSATSEWFVNVVNNTSLDTVDQGFTVFGRIISGMSVVDAIAALPRADLRSNLGGAFGEVPLTDQDTDGVNTDDLVLVNRIYVTDVIVNDSDMGSGNGGGDPDNGVQTTATYTLSTDSFTLPVRIRDTLYRVLMIRDTAASGAVFSVVTTRIFPLVDIGQETALMDLDAGTLYIPSMTVGNKIFTDLELSLTDFSTLTFKLESFNKP